MRVRPRPASTVSGTARVVIDLPFASTALRLVRAPVRPFLARARERHPSLSPHARCGPDRELPNGVTRLTLSSPFSPPPLAGSQAANAGARVSLETLRRPGYKPPEPKPGTAPQTVLNSPRSVHVCMQAGVDPINLLERDLDSFKRPGLSSALVASAHAHHLETRAKKLDALLAERATLPVGFRPPAKNVIQNPPVIKGESGVREAMRVLGNEGMIARHEEQEAKVKKQREAMEANRVKHEAQTERMQREFARKTAAVDARHRAAKEAAEKAEKARQAELFAKGQEQMRAAQAHEATERTKALERFEEEAKAREKARKAALRERRVEEAKRAERVARSEEWAKKTAAIKAKKEEEIEALRAQLESRDAKLEVYKRDLVRLRAERVEASKEGKREAIEKNLARAEELEERQREEWIQQRVARDAYVAAIKAAENTAGKAAAREAAAREKRERVKRAAAENAAARVAKIEEAVEKQRLHLAEIQRARKAAAEKVKHDRKLRAMERVERVENVARKKEVHLERLRRKIEEDAAKTHLLVATKAAMAEERQLQNCRRALVVSKRRQAEEVAQRKATRERWIASTKMDVSVEFAASAAAAAAKDEASSFARETVEPESIARGSATLSPALRGSERGFETGEENAEGGEGSDAGDVAAAAEGEGANVVVGGDGTGSVGGDVESNAPREEEGKASAPIESQPQTVAAEA